MLKHFIYILFFFITIFSLQAQTEDAWVYFTDKPNASYFYANPLKMLSQRAMERRKNQKITLDIKDVPIHANYFTQIQIANGITILAKSKWLNCVHVQGTKTDIDALRNLGFVASIYFANNSYNKKVSVSKSSTKLIDKLEVTTSFNYGNASNQIQMLHGDFLHQTNFTGAGMQIAVIDAGFTNVNTMGAFDRIRMNNQILGTYNFITHSTDVYTQHYHGTMVLSTIAGYVENQYVGTAPDASFYLFISEDATQEHPYEESLWVEAAEKADSLGVDVLTTSLAYSEFDRPEYSHTYAEMDGKTTFISRAADIAFSRGMLVINSAGNEGSNPWHYISAPADVPSVLSIGAVNPNGIASTFSSWGPNSEGIIKPDVCAQGTAAAVINTNNLIMLANGTSFSGPILAGTATCLWQAFPDKTNIEVANMIRKSGDRYANPILDFQYGYGIPNFENAYKVFKLEEIHSKEIHIFPNPVSVDEDLSVNVPQWESNTFFILMDLSGKTVKKFTINTPYELINLKDLSKGIYILQIQNSKFNFTQKLIVK